MGDAGAAARSVHLSEQSFERITPEDEPEWARFIDVAYLNGEYAHAFRDLERPREAAAFAKLSANDATRQNRARRASLAEATMARAALSDHDLAAATAAGMKAVKLAATVKVQPFDRCAEGLADSLGAAPQLAVRAGLLPAP
ncbi:hypothetical protein AB5J62_40745 [Amycolatopsis sp. cg5]|uniref:hypothetical protein n=1 Tax=Amycolatopsis sp. cg5 TaxID=3238802 RepID=UPI003525D324